MQNGPPIGGPFHLYCWLTEPERAVPAGSSVPGQAQPVQVPRAPVQARLPAETQALPEPELPEQGPPVLLLRAVAVRQGLCRARRRT